jgi:hypothetical protein
VDPEERRTYVEWATPITLGKSSTVWDLNPTLTCLEGIITLTPRFDVPALADHLLRYRNMQSTTSG